MPAQVTNSSGVPGAWCAGVSVPTQYFTDVMPDVPHYFSEFLLSTGSLKLCAFLALK